MCSGEADQASMNRSRKTEGEGLKHDMESVHETHNHWIHICISSKFLFNSLKFEKKTQGKKNVGL